MALITQDSYGFSVREGVLTLSLVRSPRPPVGEGESDRGHVMDQGVHRIEYALALHNVHAPRGEPSRERAYGPYGVVSFLY